MARRRRSSRFSKRQVKEEHEDEIAEVEPVEGAQEDDQDEDHENEEETKEEIDEPEVEAGVDEENEAEENEADEDEDDLEGQSGAEDSLAQSSPVDEQGNFDYHYSTPRSTKGRRGRPPGSKNKSTLARELATGIVRPIQRAKRPRSSLSVEGDDDDLDVDANAVGGPYSPARRPGRRPGRWPTRGGGARGRGRPFHSSSVPLDNNGVPFQVEDDELVLPIDEQGELKVNKYGELQGGRDYRVRTFTVLGRGPRLYMLSTEPARCMGFRDSYLLFQKHKKLYKIIVDDAEKFDLIQRDIIPHSYKGRAIGLVTARSVFREFGARIVIGGKRVIDDYYETEAREQGFVPGQLADIDDQLPAEGVPYNKNQYVAWHGASSVYHQYNNVATIPLTRELFKDGFAKRKQVVVTDENWMLEHASAASRYNSELTDRRRNVMPGIYEPHTSITFFPAMTQPETVEIQRASNSTDTEVESRGSDPFKPKLIVDTILYMPNQFLRTGLKDVPLEVFEHLDDDLIDEITLQQEHERQWRDPCKLES